MTSLTDQRTVTALEATTALKRCFKAKRPAFIWGPPGIGKSELIEGIADEMNGIVYDLRMSLIEPTDLKGIPFKSTRDGVEMMVWAPPIDLPTQDVCDKYETVILFLDEMNSAPPSVQAAGYQLILNRRVGQYKLPDNVVIVAAGNRESDKGVTYRMPSPLANRFVHLEMRVDFDSWFDWAVKNQISADVTGYLSFAKQDLFDFDPKGASRSFATPRSWAFVSDLLSIGNDDSTLTDLIAGTVGEGAAIKFQAHRKFALDLPNPSDILAGKVDTMKTKEISAMYSLVISMCYELKDAHKKLNDAGKGDEWHGMADNFFNFMMENFSTEIVVMGAKVALTSYKLPFLPGKLKHFDRFHKQYGSYIMAAVSS